MSQFTTHYYYYGPTTTAQIWTTIIGTEMIDQWLCSAKMGVFKRLCEKFLWKFLISKDCGFKRGKGCACVYNIPYQCPYETLIRYVKNLVRFYITNIYNIIHIFEFRNIFFPDWKLGYNGRILWVVTCLCFGGFFVLTLVKVPYFKILWFYNTERSWLRF